MISQKTLKRAISAAALLRYFPANDCDARAALGEVLVEICPDDDSLELTRGICLSLSEWPGLAHFRECVLDAINTREFARLPPPCEKCAGLSPAAQASLQERSRMLQTGSPEEILLVIAGLARDAPGWSSDREANVIAEALRVDPATAQAVARFGILQVGRKEWRAFASWLERRAPRKYGPNQNPQREHQPKVAGTRSSRLGPQEGPPKVDRGFPLTPTSPAAHRS